MNNAQRRAIESAISNVSDNLYRFKLQRDRDPNWKSGNDEPIDDIILKLEAELAELQVGF